MSYTPSPPSEDTGPSDPLAAVARPQWSPEGLTLGHVLSDAVLLLRAETFTGVTGDPWPNEGTGGSVLDAVCNNVVDGQAAGTPVYATSPIPGFQLADSSSGDPGSGPFYSIAPNALLEPGLGSFTVMAWVTWQAESVGFSNISSKIQTPPAIGAGGTGWQLVDSPFVGGTGLILSSGGSTPPTDLQLVGSAGVMTVDRHLLVGRLDRDSGLCSFWRDGVKATDADGTGLGSIEADHELIFGRGNHPQIAHGYAYWARALSDAEVAVLSAAPSLDVPLLAPLDYNPYRWHP